MNPAPSQTLALVAGYRPDGEAIMERLSVEVVADAKTADEYRLLKSPGFLRGLAAGDRIRFPARNEAGFELLKRSGNLSIRVLRKDDLDAVAQVLSPELELLDGSLDQQTLRLLVYSIHVSIGFQTLEILLDRIIGQFPGTVWYYGNVYDPADGVTPLDWWQEFLAPV
jgi:hypothetical protein